MNKIILLQHASDREMLNLVKSQTSESTKRELLIDYLKCSESLNGDILVYSPTVSSSLDWGEILHRKVELSLLKDDNMRSKITWKWNNNAEQFEYVYSILGLEDIVERHSNISHVPDFYCLLCASSFPFSQAQLDNHLRSMNHVINYLVQMELLMNKKTEKRMAKFRQFLADVLQNDNERTTGIRIYHPLGAQNFEEATKMQECIIKIFGQI
ncbi:unnamed protein product [Dracunculus medinensis]|uniref:C2H2-type domain-containing protein n=1 Tax=Dracunculus medinensis TaxID=318479 RepID=A0A0N4UGN3_DRAME|nr:unnamed protein product [Dracunculus medinensis]